MSSERVRRAARHLKTYLLLYSIVAIIIGLITGYYAHTWLHAHSGLVKDTIVALAILTIYPSMIQLRLDELGEAAKKLKAVAIGLVMVFAVAPLLAILLAPTLPNKQVSMGFVLTNVVPASSASIGYVLITAGSIELATVLSVLTIFGAFASIPGYMGLYARLSSVHVPMALVMKSLGITLLTPLVAGQLTRYYLIHRRADKALRTGDGRYSCLQVKLEGGLAHEVAETLSHLKRCIRAKLEKELKPHLSLWTMITMIILIALLVANKAMIIITKPMLAVDIFALQAAILFTLFGIVTAVDKLLRMTYEDHMAIAFISATKNASVAAAIAVTALSPLAAVPAALIPVIQAPIAISYVQVAPKLRRYFPSRQEARVRQTGANTAKITSQSH